MIQPFLNSLFQTSTPTTNPENIMSLSRQLFVKGVLSRPLRGDAEPWQYVGSAASPRAVFDPFARRVRPRSHSLKVTFNGWKTLLNVLRSR